MVIFSLLKIFFFININIMDLEKFKKYVDSRKKLNKEFDDVDILEQKYNNLVESKKKYNEYQRNYYKERINGDEEFKQLRKEYNKKSYQKQKQSKDVEDEDEDEQEPEEKVTVLIKPIKKEKNSSNSSNTKIDNNIEKNENLIPIKPAIKYNDSLGF
jgi:hypothetical protein